MVITNNIDFLECVKSGYKFQIRCFHCGYIWLSKGFNTIHGGLCPVCGKHIPPQGHVRGII